MPHHILDSHFFKQTDVQVVSFLYPLVDKHFERSMSSFDGADWWTGRVFLIWYVHHLSPRINPCCLQPISMSAGAIIFLCLQLSSSMHMQFRHASEGQFRLMSQIKLFQNIKEKCRTSVNYMGVFVCWSRECLNLSRDEVQNVAGTVLF